MKAILVLGDSIARGDGASTPEQGFVRRFSERRGAQRIYFLCRGGATSAVGADWARYAWCEPAPELVIVAYGMNDQTLHGRLRRRPQVEPREFGENLRRIVHHVRQRWADVDIVLVAPAPAHPGWDRSSGRT